ncbi:uncharacterized protein B0T15DRAFT_523607 [Chaetomium strumarium]|uniref:Secreted protein n=1 Tax=Chaetomium strumarium TaxID=1170767 RepID=A0AAJ0GXW0_9PEZI|nr:hypothetical protein B0T15DRAFT_523607 [Chaetomium strumarium]
MSNVSLFTVIFLLEHLIEASMQNWISVSERLTHLHLQHRRHSKVVELSLVELPTYFNFRKKSGRPHPEPSLRSSINLCASCHSSSRIGRPDSSGFGLYTGVDT